MCIEVLNLIWKVLPIQLTHTWCFYPNMILCEVAPTLHSGILPKIKKALVICINKIWSERMKPSATLQNSRVPHNTWSKTASDALGAPIITGVLCGWNPSLGGYNEKTAWWILKNSSEINSTIFYLENKPSEIDARCVLKSGNLTEKCFQFSLDQKSTTFLTREFYSTGFNIENFELLTFPPVTEIQFWTTLCW